jgi:protein STE50
LSEAVVSTVDGFHAWRLSQHSVVRPFYMQHSVASAKLHFQVEGSSIGRQPSFKWAQYDKSSNSPTKPEMSDSPHPSPNRLEHDLTSRSQLGMQNKNANNSSTTLSTQPSTDNLKTFKVSLEDPAWKVLPAALRKYKINNDDWQNYAMFICYGGPSMWFLTLRGLL